MTDPKKPSGDSDLDDLDALLDGLTVDEPTPAKPVKPLYAPPVAARPPAPPPRPKPAEPADLNNLFEEDEDETGMPTRMVDIAELKQVSGDAPRGDVRGRAGLGDMFAPSGRATAPPPKDEAALRELTGEMTGLKAPGTPGDLAEEAFADLALEDEELAATGRAPAGAQGARSAPPPLPRSGPPRPPSLEEQLGLSDSDEEATLDAEPDDGPVFETSGEEEEETISLEVGDDEEVSVDAPVAGPRADDRGALLAATVTSRKRADEDLEKLYATDPRTEAETRVALLESEAEYADTPERAAELYCLAGELCDGALGDAARAKALVVKAFEQHPASPFVLRAMRRIALLEEDVERARELCDAELELPLTDDEREALEALAAEVAAREGAAPAEARWETIAGGEGARAAVARLFVGGSRHDSGVMGDALGALGQTSTGVLAGAANLARARLAETAAEADTALAAVQAAVQRDPSDVGSWLAMARLAVTRENGQAFREAMSGIARVAPDSAAGWAAVALDRATGAVLSDAVAPAAVPMAGVGAWLVAHALRDGGLDDAPQITASLEAAANDAQRSRWAVLTSDAPPEIQDDVGRLLALRRAVAAGDATAVATAAGGLLSHDEAGRAAVSAALLARKGELAAGEAAPLEQGDALHLPPLAFALLAGTQGVDAADRRSGALGAAEQSELARVAAVGMALRADGDRAAARRAYEALADDAGASAAVRLVAAREAARLSDELTDTAAAIAREAQAETHDAARAAAAGFVMAALGAHLNIAGAAETALKSARALGGDLAAAELVALYGLRGELSPGDTADALAAAADDSAAPAWRMAAVRAALRRAAVDADAAADALYKVWQKSPGDGALAALTLRALPPTDADRRVSVLRALAERSQSESAAAALAGWTVVAHTLEDARRPADAAQALARARTHAVGDPALLAWEERLWLRAGMLAEAAERSFDALKAAADDDARIAAYERLAEIDSAFRQDVASAVLTYQAILELAPGHMSSLRTLERYFLEQGRFDELLGVYDRLIRHVADPEDALALAHAAARIATQQADGDTGAGTPFWTAAFERGAADLRLLVALDGETRRAGDTRRFADVMTRLEALVTDPDERATAATRVGEALALLGDAQQATAAFERAVTARPNHPTALAWLAIARETGGDPAAAAEASENRARAAKSPAIAVAGFLRAGVLWQDKVGDLERARAALWQVLALEPAHPEAFARAMRVLQTANEPAAELELLTRRVEAGTGEPQELLPFHVRIAELAEQQGDPAAARNALKNALAIDPDRLDALRALARLSQTGGDWAGAADAMIRLARLTTDDNERAELMFNLGAIFDEHLKDLKRAEAAYGRVIKMRPGDLRTLQRLASLYSRSDNGEAEVDTLRQLIEATAPGRERRELQIRMAAVMGEKLNAPKKAEEVLEAARREAPTDMDVLRGFARLYTRQQDPAALVVLLDRAAADVRRTLETDLANGEKLELLADMLKLRGRVDGARVVAALAFALGVANEKLTQLAREGVVPGAGAHALTAEVLELLVPPTVTTGHRELFRLSADVLEKLVPFEPGALRAEKLGARPHPLRAEVDRWARAFGLESCEIFLGPTTPLVVMPISRHPPAVLIPHDLREGPLARFAIARAMCIVALSLPLAVRLPPKELTVVLGALLRQFEPMFALEGVELAQLDDLARRITRALPRQRHAEMSAHAFEVIGIKGTDGATVEAGVIELATRVALLASGDVIGGVRALTPPGEEPRNAANTVPALKRLCLVALSERFIEARHQTGADRAAPAG